MKTSATNRKLRILLKSIKDETLIPNPEFQRRLVWTNKDKLSFLETVLKGYPFPEIYIASGDINPDTGEGLEMIVDGQQRMTTLFQYFNSLSEIKLGSNITPFKELTDDQKIDFLEYEVVIRDLGKKSIKEIKEIFMRINSTKYALNAMEIHNARYDGELKKFVEEFSTNEIFEKYRIFSSSEIRRMGDIIFCLTIVISIISNYFNRTSDIESYLEKYNDEFEYKEKLKKELDYIVKIICGLELPHDCRSWNKADLLTLFVEIYNVIYKDKLNIDWTGFSKKLLYFYNLVDTSKASEVEIVKDYKKSITAGTNDRNSRIRRGEIIRGLIHEFKK